MESKNEWSFINLNRIREQSPTLDLSKEIFKSKKLFNIYFSDVSPSLVFDGDNETIKRKIRNRSFKRALKYIGEQEGSDLQLCCKDKGRTLDLLNIFFEQHKKKWNNTSTPSIFNDETHKQFFNSLMVSLMQKGQMELFYLSLNQKPVAFQLVFLYDDIFLQYIPTYDADYVKYSPGTIMLVLVLEYCMSGKLKEYDFLRGGEK
jgi:CelD/BcsL family acetyltransferase involved in cellulose biosynthesis